MDPRPVLALAVLLLALPAAAGGEDAAQAPPASTDCAPGAIQAIQGRYEAMRDLHARFEQTAWSVTLGGAAGRAPSVSKGEVWFAKPGKMRWAYEEPAPSLVVSDGETLWIYDPAFQEAQKLPVGDGYLSGAAIQFLLGEGDLQREFEVAARACEPGSAELALQPREPASYERLEVVADLASGDLRKTRIVDLLGNVTEVTFLDIEVNQDPPADHFRFEAPEGVRVIELEPPPTGAP